MLVHQTWDTEGAGAASVNISDSLNLNSRGSGDCYSGYQFGADGVLSKVQANGGLSSIMGQWLLVGTSDLFWLQRTILSGTLEVDAGTGWLQMNTSRLFENIQSSAGESSAAIFIEIASDSGGVTVVASATFNFTSIQGSL